MAKDSIISDSEDDTNVIKKSKESKSFTGVHKLFDVGFEAKDQEPPRTTQLVYSYKGGKKVPKLKEPRNLYTFYNEKGFSAPRWPVEVKVLPIRPRHIISGLNTCEPFYKPDNSDESDATHRVTPSEGQIVYDNSPGPEFYFMRSRVGGCQANNVPYYKLKSVEDKTLLFESRFESGNLLRAVKVRTCEYELWLRNDLYTKKHTQWFYFRVQNAQPGVKYRFTIVNLIKSGSLYNAGMRPLMYSEIESVKKKTGWTRVGENIKYYKNSVRRADTTKEKYHYSLTWTCDFPHEDDTCYFAHCYPYTYSDLQEYLAAISNDPVRTRICKQKVLCRTLAGNFVHILTITNPSKRPVDAEVKRFIVVSARVHPGETNSSWMMKGLLDFLTSNAPDAKLLRDMFIFKIVPMINPDGVVVGNYRCSLTGRDLNRNYKTVLKDSFPPIWHLRNMVKKLLDERQVVLYLDLHGHSKKHNVFIYGCENRLDPMKRFRERIFPVMMSKNAPNKFSYPGCKFKVQKHKEGTGRVVMWRMGILNSFTMEATFGGSSLDNRSGFHFSCGDFESMGFHLCDTLLDYCDPDDTKYVRILKEIEMAMRSTILERMKKKGDIPASYTAADINFETDYLSDIESSTGGSDSSMSDGLPMHLIYAPNALQMYQPKKKKLKSRKERNKRRAKALIVKNVHLTNLNKLNQESPEIKIQEKNLSEKKPVHGLFKYENPRPRKHEHRESCTPIRQKVIGECLHTETVEEAAAMRTDLLEAVTNAYMMNGVLVTNVDESPQFCYTGGITPCRGRSTPARWSNVASPAQALANYISEDEESFTINYLARQLERNIDCTIPRVHSEMSISSARDRARKIAMCNARYKSSVSVEPLDAQVPLLRPTTPVQPYQQYPWQPKSDYLSSTKATLYEQWRSLGTMKDQEPRINVPQISILKGKKKNPVPKSLEKQASEISSNGKTNMEGAVNTNNKTNRREKSVELDVYPKYVQGKVDVRNSKPPHRKEDDSMRKYTTKNTASADGDPKQPVGFAEYEAQLATSAFSGKMKTKTPPAKDSEDISFIYGRRSPVFVAVPVKTPSANPKLKHKRKNSREELEPGDVALSTINELRTRLMGSSDTGAVLSFAVNNQEMMGIQRKEVVSVTRTSPPESNSDSDKDERNNVNDVSYRSQGILTSTYSERPLPLETEVKNHNNTGTVVKDAGKTDHHGSRNSNKGKVYYLNTSRQTNEKTKSSESALVNTCDFSNNDLRIPSSSSREPHKETNQLVKDTGESSGPTPSTISLTFQFSATPATRESKPGNHQRPSGVPIQYKHMFKTKHR